MLYSLRWNGTVVGTSKLENADASMGVAFGSLDPTDAYGTLRPVFRLYADAIRDTSAQPTDQASLERYYRERDALGLELVDETGGVIPTSSIHVHDYSVEAPGEPLELEAHVEGKDFWQRRDTT
jgi:hypothetical protein